MNETIKAFKQKIDELEKRVAELEGQVQEQPRVINNYVTNVNKKN